MRVTPLDRLVAEAVLAGGLRLTGNTLWFGRSKIGRVHGNVVCFWTARNSMRPIDPAPRLQERLVTLARPLLPSLGLFAP